MTKVPLLAASAAVVAGSIGVAAYSLSTYPQPAPHLATAALAHGSAAAAPGTASDSLFGVFEGRTPCGAIATEFTGFPAQNCEKIKWRLTLYRDPTTRNPTTYVFHGTRSTRRGEWRIEHRAGPEQRCVLYHLDYDGPAKILSLLAVDEGVLLLLDRELNVLVGDASWSYALNRIQPSAP